MPASGYGFRRFKNRPKAEPEPALIDGLLSRDGSGFILGLPKSYKTLLAMEMALCLAEGLTVAGRFTVPQARRVHFLEEDTDSAAMLEQRFDALLRGHGLDPEDTELQDRLEARLAIKPWSGFSFDDPDCRIMLEEQVCRDYRAEICFLDVLRNLTEKNLNTSDEIGPILNFLTGLHEKYGTVFLLLHHEGYSGAGRPMGTVTLGGWWQNLLCLERTSDTASSLIVQRKQGPTGYHKLSLYAEGDEEQTTLLRFSAESGKTAKVLDGKLLEIIGEHHSISRDEIVGLSPSKSERAIDTAIAELRRDGKIKIVSHRGKAPLYGVQS